MLILWSVLVAAAFSVLLGAHFVAFVVRSAAWWEAAAASSSEQTRTALSERRRRFILHVGTAGFVTAVLGRELFKPPALAQAIVTQQDANEGISDEAGLEILQRLEARAAARAGQGRVEDLRLSMDGIALARNGVLASDETVEAFLLAAYAILRALEGESVSRLLRVLLIESVFPRIAFGMTRRQFADALARKGRVQEFDIFGQERPESLEFDVPTLASFTHPNDHIIGGGIHTSMSSVAGVRQVVTFEDREGTLTVQSFSSDAIDVDLPTAGVIHVSLAVGPLGRRDVSETLIVRETLTPLVQAVVKPPICRLNTAWCRKCIRHTLDCLAVRRDCLPTITLPCFIVFREHGNCNCMRPLTDGVGVPPPPT